MFTIAINNFYNPNLLYCKGDYSSFFLATEFNITSFTSIKSKFLTSACKVSTFNLQQPNTSLLKCNGQCELTYLRIFVIRKAQGGYIWKKKLFPPIRCTSIWASVQNSLTERDWIILNYIILYLYPKYLGQLKFNNLEWKYVSITENSIHVRKFLELMYQ
jgi:hypothetical protein